MLLFLYSVILFDKHGFLHNMYIYIYINFFICSVIKAIFFQGLSDTPNKNETEPSERQTVQDERCEDPIKKKNE